MQNRNIFELILNLIGNNVKFYHLINKQNYLQLNGNKIFLLQ